MQKTTTAKIQRASLLIFYGLLAYMPLHVFISTIAGANLGFLEAAKVFKDIVLVFGFCLILLSSIKQDWFKGWTRNWLVVLIGLYVAHTVGLALYRPTDLDAEILGVVYNTRFLMFFLYAWLLAKTFPPKQIRLTALKIVSTVGLFVVLFGIVQYLFLPDDFLIHFGFTRENGVFSAFFIDNKPDLERVMSTLRDPNSLGSYLIITGSLVAAGIVVERTRRNTRLLYIIATLLCLWFTFSRSAWIGFVMAAIVFAILHLKNQVRVTRSLMLGGVVALSAIVILAGGVLFAARNSYFVQNVILHADQSTTMEDPNELRIRFFQESVQSIADNPVGSGPGTAGLASIRNNVQGTVLNENYYLQIATEVGIVGLGLFLAILVLTAVGLYHANPNDRYAFALLASFAGLAFTNFLVHIWSNEAVAYTWWGLAGLYMVADHKITKNKTRQ